MLTSSAHAQRNRMDGSAYQHMLIQHNPEIAPYVLYQTLFRVVAREGLGTRLGIFSRIS